MEDFMLENFSFIRKKGLQRTGEYRKLVMFLLPHTLHLEKSEGEGIR